VSSLVALSDFMDTRDQALIKVAIVMAAFNRRDTTLDCLRSIERQEHDGSEFTVYVVDDASHDGTGEAISRSFPQVRLIGGDGQLYWNGGMRVGLDAAYRDDHDYYWWLNDDVKLDPDAFTRLLDTARAQEHSGKPAIVVGSLRDPDDGSLSYGGVSRLNRLRRMDFTLIEPKAEPVPAETMNGNCVLVAASVAYNVGNLTSAYRQKMGGSLRWL